MECKGSNAFFFLKLSGAHSLSLVWIFLFVLDESVCVEMLKFTDEVAKVLMSV